MSATPGVRYIPVVCVLNLTILPLRVRYYPIIYVENQRSRLSVPANLSHRQITGFRDVCTYPETVLPDINSTKGRPIRPGRTSTTRSNTHEITLLSRFPESGNCSD